MLLYLSARWSTSKITQPKSVFSYHFEEFLNQQTCFLIYLLCMARSTDKRCNVKSITHVMLFLQVVPSAFIWKILKVQCPYQKLLQWLLLSRAGLLNHETRVTTSSNSLPRAANQELRISWSECQTSLAPSKNTWTSPHSSSNEVLCWTPRLFEYCTQVCSHWARRSLLELWPRAVCSPKVGDWLLCGLLWLPDTMSWEEAKYTDTPLPWA